LFLQSGAALASVKKNHSAADAIKWQKPPLAHFSEPTSRRPGGFIREKRHEKRFVI
jgi:hypothetical protein